jgi:hypothetical protein
MSISGGSRVNDMISRCMNVVDKKILVEGMYRIM